MARTPAIFQGFVNFCWFTIKWGLLLAAVAALVAAPYLYHRMDEEVRLRVEQTLGRHYQQLLVTVRSARLVEGEGIVVRGVSFRDPQSRDPQNELLALDEVLLECPTELRQLMQADLEIRRLVLRRPTLRATRLADGQWSSGKLLPLPQRNGAPPEVVIEDGVVEVIDPQPEGAHIVRLREAQLRVVPTTEASLVSGGRAPLRLQGTASSDDVRQIALDALIDPSGSTWRANGQVQGLAISPSLSRALPQSEAKPLLKLDGVRAQGDARFRVDYQQGRIPAFDYELTGQLSQGRVDDPRLPYPLTELRADVACSPRGAQLRNLTCRIGQARVSADIERWGFDECSPLRLEVRAQQLSLDGKLLEMVPPQWQGEWYKYMPTGEIDATVKAEYDGQQWRPEVSLNCHQVSFTHHKFPYRLDRGRGTIDLKDGLLQCRLTAYSDHAEVRITTQLQTHEHPASGWADVQADNVRLDEKLWFAMPEQTARWMRSMHPSGSMNVAFRWWRESGPHSVPHRQAQFNVQNCSVKLDAFPYPIHAIQGVVELHDSVVSFRDLHGTNDAGHIVCNGRVAPLSEGGYEMLIRAAGGHIVLDDELREALPASAQQLWSDARPRGQVNVQVEVQRQSGEQHPRVWVRAEPVDETVALDPVHFPYRLERLRGVIGFSDGRVTFENLQAEHGRTLVAARGIGVLQNDGGWSLHIEQFTCDRLVADRDFMAAVPQRIKRLATDLDVRGPVSLRGAIDLSGGRAGDLFQSQWNVLVDFQQTSLNAGVRLENLNGGVSLVGNFDGREFRCRGDVNIDSVTWQDHQVTDVRGPLWIDESRVLLGYWADRIREVRPERRLTGRLYGGEVTADGWVTFGPKPQYQLQAALAQADLSRMILATAAQQQRLQGQLSARIELAGSGVNAHELTGRGGVQLRDADIYELPLMVSLFKLVSARPPDSTAFTTSDIDFRIEGQHVYVDRIDLNGDAISLLGKGEIGLDKQINLSFYATIGRDENRLPGMRYLLGGAAQQIMQIHAEGTLAQPIVRREAFPGVNQALQQLQAEFQSRERNRVSRGNGTRAQSQDIIQR